MSAFLSEYGVTKISSMDEIKKWAFSKPTDKHLRVVIDAGGPVFLSLLLSNIKRKSYTHRQEDTQPDFIIQQIKSETERKGHGTRAVQMMLELAHSIGHGIHVQSTHTDASKALCFKLGFYSDTEGENFFSPYPIMWPFQRCVLLWQRQKTKEQDSILMNTVLSLLNEGAHIVLNPHKNKSIQFEPWDTLKLETLSGSFEKGDNLISCKNECINAFSASDFTHVIIYDIKEIQSDLQPRPYLIPNKWHEIKPQNEGFMYLLKNSVADNTKAGGNIVVAVKANHKRKREEPPEDLRRIIQKLRNDNEELRRMIDTKRREVAWKNEQLKNLENWVERNAKKSKKSM